MSSPLRISILTPSYRCAAFLHDCVRSVLQQGYGNLEHIVIDAASTDGTVDILKSYPHLKWISEPDNGEASALNKALSMATGDLLCWLNADDWFVPGALAQVVQTLNQHPDSAIIYGQANMVDASGQLRWVKQPLPEINLLELVRWWHACVLPHQPSMFFRRHVIDSVGPFNEQLHFSIDLDFWLRASLKFAFRHLPSPLSNARVRVDSKSLDTEPDQIQSHWNVTLPHHRHLSQPEQLRFWAEYFLHRLFERKDPEHTRLANTPPWAGGLLVALGRVPSLPAAIDHLFPTPAERAEVHRALAALPAASLSPATQRTLHSIQALVAEPASPPNAELIVKEPAAARLEVPVARPDRPPLIWMAPWQNPSGYCGEALGFLEGLAPHWPIQCLDVAVTRSAAFVKGLPASQRECLGRALTHQADPRGAICIQHLPASGFASIPEAAWTIGRTMFETDRLPPAWVDRANALDEIWVPSSFNLETFAASGVCREKLRIVPPVIDPHFFDRTRVAPLSLPDRAATNFLAVFEWSLRKGWDVLLRAYLQEFSAEDDVCLYLRTYLADRPDDDSHATLQRMLAEFTDRLGLGNKPLPRIRILSEQVPASELPRLYRAVDCLVAPSRGEGWGRPQFEAMLMELPVIATNWSGSTAFMTPTTAYLLDFALVEARGLPEALAHYQGHRWAEPDATHLRQLFRNVQQRPPEAKARGQSARAQLLQHFAPEQIVAQITQRLQEIADQRPPRSPKPATRQTAASAPSAKPSVHPQPVVVQWEGSFAEQGSLAHVNRLLTQSLERNTPDLELRRLDPAVTAAPGPGLAPASCTATAPQIIVRHSWPPRWDPPGHGSLVIMQPWEFGALPRDWVQRAPQIDQFWVYSEYLRSVYLASGIEAAKIRLVPLGIDPQTFRPEAAPLALPTRKSFRFLFVGGTIHRKGADLLLRAYLDSFTASDDVCLVIKDFGTDSFYAGQTLAAQIKDARSRPGAPEVLYLIEDLPSQQMPALYNACHALVHPYRGEGFGLTVLEAMACGLPVIVTTGGSTDDFAPPHFTYLVAATRTSIGYEVGGWRLTNDGWLLEPDLHQLASQMRHVFSHRDEAAARGREASRCIRRDWTWQRSAAVAASLLRELAARRRPATSSNPAATPPMQPVAPAPIALPPAALKGHLGAAAPLLRQRQFTAAWNAVIASIDERPFHPEAYLMLAETALGAGDSVTARHCADRARKLAPDWKPARQFRKKHLRGNAKFQWPGLERILAIPSSPRLTVCLIVQNEEEFLGRCLQSVNGVAHQIVVLDTGSTDRTVAIAREHGAEVHSFPWCDDFSAARNAALEHARGDWILMLDADEELLESSRSTLRRELQDAAVLGYRLPIVDAGKEDEGHNYVPRLFRNAPGLFYVGRIHEQIFSSLEVRRKEWGLTNILAQTTLRHHGYRPDLITSRDKISRNLRLLERAVAENPGDPNLAMNHGLELVRSGDLHVGLQQYRRAVELLAKGPADQIVPELRETLFTQFSSYLLRAKRPGDVLELLDSNLLPLSAFTATLFFNQGLAQLELHQFEEAARSFRQCMAIRGRQFLTPTHAEVKKAGPEHCLALCLHQLRQDDLALEALQHAIRQDPASLRVCLDYASLLAAQGRKLDALKALHQYISHSPQAPEAWELGGRVALSQPDFIEFADDWTSEALKAHPQHGVIGLQRAEALLLRQQPRAAFPLWQQHRRPGDPSHLAALIICELLDDHPLRTIHPAQQTAVSQAVLKWYRRLIDVQALETLDAFNQRLPHLAAQLPTAHRTLAAAVETAQAPALA